MERHGSPNPVDWAAFLNVVSYRRTSLIQLMATLCGSTERKRGYVVCNDVIDYQYES